MRIVFYSLISLFFAGCGQTLEGLENLNQRPSINFTISENAVLRDSIKLSLKNSQEKYTVRLSVFDENNNIREIRYQQELGAGTLLQNGDTIEGNEIEINNAFLEFEYYPSVLGLHRYSLTIEDNFDERSSIALELVAFNNISPVARMQVSRIGQRDPREYAIDGIESFDRDENFGGGIVEYEFQYLGKIIRRLQPRIEVIFPEDNTYTVKVRVRDNDQAWSALVEETIVID
jgi:hypothetical protein